MRDPNSPQTFDIARDAILATRGDIARLEASSRTDIGDVKTSIAVVQAELAIVKWMVGGIGFGMLMLILKSFVPGIGH
ncbi:MAG: hypothetical protein H7840_02100 [Alphaproteobacteria bacterium]